MTDLSETIAREMAPKLALIVERLASKALREALAMKPRDELWGCAEVAEYLKVTPRHVSDVLASTHGFPPEIRLPAGTETGRGRPKWKSIEVRAWVEKHRGK